MSQFADNAREGFLCPQCHQDMASMEMLQVHFQNAHMKQASTSGKGFFSMAKQKIKSVQGNTKASAETGKSYAQYFSFNANDQYAKQQYIGYTSSHNDIFKSIRKTRRDEIFKTTNQLLLRVELLTSASEHVPPNRNTKERRKFEQGLVPWMEDSVTPQCVSCKKPFGISKRKHHCRLDGRIICSQCSRLLPFPVARDLVDPSASPLSMTTHTVLLQRLASLPSVTSSTATTDGSNEDHLRMCLSCEQVLKKYHNQIRYKNIAIDDILHLYEKITHAEKEYKRLQSTYATMISSLLNGNAQYQLVDAQRLYRELSVHYQKIDSTSKQIVNAAENEPTAESRYVAFGRNIRTYCIQVLQTFAISTRRVPTEDDIKQARDEKKRAEDAQMVKFAASIPGMKGDLSEIPPELEPFIQQYQLVTQFLEQAKQAGRQDEVRSLESNLKELEQAISEAQLH